MKKKTENKQCIKTSFFDWVKITLFTGFCMLILFSVTMLIVSYGWTLLYNLGYITESNYRRVYIFDFAVVTTLVGCAVSVFIVRLPVTWTTNLIKGIRSISHGNYDTRLRERKIKQINKVAKEFNVMAQQLEITETLSHDFINNFSHECKTPIASINGFAKILKNKNLTEQERNEYLDIIIDESERLNNLATDILNLSRLENQMILTNAEKTDITEQIRETVARLYKSNAEKNIEIILSEERHFVNGNKSMLDIVWQNLISNAIKFSDENTVINIDVKTEKNTVIISIKNKGSVISEEQKSRLFEKFYQCDESHATKGNGLGLAIVKRITQLHEGDIVLKKSDENATVFEVTLPKFTEKKHNEK